MKNFPKAGLLIATLVIPALIFLLLQLFARNHYDLPYFNPELDANGKVVYESGDTLFHQVSEKQGLTVGYVLKGKLTVIHYLPQNCNDSCELGISQLQRIAALRNGLPDLNLLMLTSDLKDAKVKIPEAGRKQWEVKVAAENEIATFSIKELGLKTEIARTTYPVVLIDTKGFVRGYYHLTDPKETERLMAEIKILSYEGETTD